MPPSHRKINYSLRPAKCVERKMMCEAIRCLADFTYIQDYMYVGFGSLSFTDFVLFHKELNICNMISIEREGREQERFNFNIPFSCIELKIGESNEKLTEVPWAEKVIVWLDYDSRMSDEILADIKYVCTNAIPGSIIIVSCNIQTNDLYNKTQKIHTINSLVERRKVPLYNNRDLQGDWWLGNICRRIMVNEIEETLRNRNGVLDEQQMIIFKQLFNFRYADGARMFTMGGILIENSDVERYKGSSVNDLSFVKHDEQTYIIAAPILTIRERGYLDSLMPVNSLDGLELRGIPEDLVNCYLRIYRYYPFYLEVEM